MLLSRFFKWLDELLWALIKGDTPMEPIQPTPTPITPLTEAPVVSQTHSKDMLTIFCTALRDFEGKPGDLNYLLNNPGDCRPSPVGYLAKYQPVVIIDTNTNPKYLYHKGKFAMFPTYAIGWEYLVNLVHYTAVKHPDWTILDFFKNWAPSSDNNNPTAYANNVAVKCGMPVNSTLAQLFT